MAKYLLKRIAYILVSLFFIITITFALMKLAPGGPFTSERKTSPAIEAANERSIWIERSNPRTILQVFGQCRQI